jgi:hypothetical protein
VHWAVFKSQFCGLLLKSNPQNHDLKTDFVRNVINYGVGMKQVLAFVTIFLLSVNNVSAETVIPKGVGCDTDSGECFIILVAPYISKNCGGSNDQLRLDPNKPASKNQYSTALAAYLAGKKLEVGATSCVSGQPSPSYLYITN